MLDIREAVSDLSDFFFVPKALVHVNVVVAVVAVVAEVAVVKLSSLELVVVAVVASFLSGNLMGET